MTYLYTYGWRPEEGELCMLEMRTMLGTQAESGMLLSTHSISADRSPFMREKLEILYVSDSLEEMYSQTAQIHLEDKTFKVIVLKHNDLVDSQKIDYDERRSIERIIGEQITGEADLKNPNILYGLTCFEGKWYFGYLTKSKAIWLDHMQKPRSYSIALSTRVARAVANITVPKPDGIKAIDPCCGIGTVLVEALSMGIHMVGRDINHFIVKGTRENLAHFNLTTEVVCGDISEIEEHYDAAIVDMPYNHFSHTTPEHQLMLLSHARRIADRVVIVSVGDIDEMLEEVGLQVIDRCTTRKGNFVRQIIVCS